ncbi:MAG: bifunctional 4-hydroxy-2-oxoglutarate aldolase/2-dehydro-3-deoxy-phosphogluconate aldolase [Casimicrobium sp.]|jgi:2-dehydro-3-deoxyphosphogluconate aldolase/(4S)-4-hydroxy-2-oxoglutarate aldolase
MDLNLTLRKLGYVPVAIIDDVNNAVPLAEALIAGGIGSIEVTLRTGAGLASINAIVKSGLPILVGVGTVTLAEQVPACVDAGAKFAVCPGFTHEVGSACRNALLPLLPGAVTPTEVLNCLDEGYTVQKFFPATVFGGAAWLKMIEAPIPQVNFCATGVAASDIPAVLACTNVAAIGSSAVATRDMVAAKNWALITENAKKMMALVRESRTL